jgi:hypothetical protein
MPELPELRQTFIQDAVPQALPKEGLTLDPSPGDGVVYISVTDGLRARPYSVSAINAEGARAMCQALQAFLTTLEQNDPTP